MRPVLLSIRNWAAKNLGIQTAVWGGLVTTNSVGQALVSLVDVSLSWGTNHYSVKDIAIRVFERDRETTYV